MNVRAVFFLFFIARSGFLILLLLLRRPCITSYYTRSHNEVIDSDEKNIKQIKPKFIDKCIIQ